jgi:hypothetical protein
MTNYNRLATYVAPAKAGPTCGICNKNATDVSARGKLTPKRFHLAGRFTTRLVGTFGFGASTWYRVSLRIVECASNGRAIELDANQPMHLDYGYAMTNHSSQGQTAERVFVHVDTELGIGL